jgi:hypothetical protein
VTDAESGFFVTPTTSTRQDPTRIAKRTNIVRSRTVSTVKKIQRRDTPGLGPDFWSNGPAMWG